MPSSRILMFVYAAYWIFLVVIVLSLEKKIKVLEAENEKLKKEVEWHGKRQQKAREKERVCVDRGGHRMDILRGTEPE